MNHDNPTTTGEWTHGMAVVQDGQPQRIPDAAVDMHNAAVKAKDNRIAELERRLQDGAEAIAQGRLYFEQLAAAQAAIEAEPELPGGMPAQMWAAIKDDQDAATELCRIIVRLTKDGIRKDVGDTTALDAAIEQKRLEIWRDAPNQADIQEAVIVKLDLVHRDAITAAQQPLVDVLEKYMTAMDAIYNHNEAARAAVVQHFGTLHPPEVFKLLVKVKEGK